MDSVGTRWGRHGRLLRRYLAPQRAMALVMAAALIISTVLQLASPRLVRGFIDAATAGAPLKVLYRLALGFLAMSLLTQAVKVAAEYWSERVAWVASNALRLDLVRHILDLDANFHRAHTPGELIERVDGDANALAGLFSSFTVRIVGSLLLLLGVVASLLWESPVLGAAFGAFAILAAVLLGWVERLAVPVLTQSREHSASFYGYLSEAISARDDLRTCGALPYAFGRFRGLLHAWLPVQLRAGVLGNVVWIAALLVFALADALAYALGGGLYRRGVLSLGTVYMILTYAALVAQPLETLRTELQHLQQAEAGLERVIGLLAIRSRLPEGTADLPPGPLSVEFHGVSFRYDDGDDGGGADILREVSFRLDAGRRLGILGRTGSGKTTVARLLTRLYDPRVGAVRLGGVDLRDANLHSVRARAALVSQDVRLLQASVRHNITLFRGDVPDALLVEVLQELGLGPWLRRLPDGLDTPVARAGLSGGEAQLLAFAPVMLRDPGLVVLDEASSRLDLETEETLVMAVERLLQGRTAVIITHRPATMERVDDLLILEDGRVVEYGPRLVLTASPASRSYQLGQVEAKGVLG